MNDFVTSLIRTWTPIIAGTLIGWGIAQGLPVDKSMEAGLTALLAAGLSGLYYLAVRLAEQRWPAAGWLLGVAKPPAYPVPPAVPARVPPAG
jgi:hypothetical protein